MEKVPPGSSMFTGASKAQEILRFKALCSMTANLGKGQTEAEFQIEDNGYGFLRLVDIPNMPCFDKTRTYTIILLENPSQE